MEFRGIFEDGVVRPTGPVDLPEGTEVEFHAKQNGAAKPELKNWESKSVEELAREQGVGPVNYLADLGIGWPEDEDVDEFIEAVRQWRRE